MRILLIVLLSLILVLSAPFFAAYVYGENIITQASQFPFWLVLRFRDYNTDMPVSNMSVTVRVNTDWGLKTVTSVPTNQSGTIQIFMGNITKPASYRNRSLQEIVLSDNYTLIKVQNVFLEDASLSSRNYQADYVANFTRYRGLQIDLDYKESENQLFLAGNIWILNGTLVRVLDRDPFTGNNVSLLVAPAIKTNLKSNISEYESCYLFPLNYEVTIFHGVRTLIDYDTRKMRSPNEPVFPLKVRADENTTLVNWMSHAALDYADRQISYMDREMEWLRSAGYPLDQEYEEYQAVKGLLERVLDLYQRGEIFSALGGAKIYSQKLGGLSKWVSDIKALSVWTTAGISLFAYGLASLLSSFFFEEPSQNRIRLGLKVLCLSLVMLMFSLSHPSVRMAFALIVGARKIDLLTSLLGCFIFGGLTYFAVQILSVRKKGVTDLAVQLGVRSLKRRKSRTILTLTTIIIIVSSAIVFVNISLNRSTRIKGQWNGSGISGVLVKPDTEFAPLTEYDINWTRAQRWSKDLGYTEGVWFSEIRQAAVINRIGVLLLDEEIYQVNITGIDPLFMQRQYGFSEHVRGFWDEFVTGEPVAIVPTTLGIALNEPIALAFEEIIGDLIIIRQFGEFRVVGTFDPYTAFAGLTKIDNTPLFEDSPTLVLVPIKSINDRAITISEVTILTNEGFDPVEVAEELAYTLAATTIANKDGLAQRISWSVEFSVAGLLPYAPPLVMAGLMTYATMVSVYEERKREFTTLAVLGLDPGNTFQVFLVEALLLGLMGTFIGFFGSYILGAGLLNLSVFLGTKGPPAFSLPLTHWSMPAILVALLTGVVMVFLGAYVPAARTQGLSLMGREKRRQMVGELISEGDITTLTLPIRETIQNGEMLYTYVRETVGKVKSSLVDPHSVKGEMYRDGTFKVSFYAIGEGFKAVIPCEIKGVKEEEMLVPVIEFPTSFRPYFLTRDIIRDLEEYMIGFSAWKEMQLKMTIVRESPKRRKTVDEILAEIKSVIDQIKDSNKKLKILEGQKGKLSEEVYNEFREKYNNMIEEKSKTVRSMTINLEPYHKELREEIDKLSVEVERITTAYNLGEITEEEYVRTCGPLQGRLAELKSDVQEMEDIFDFLKKPMRTSYE